MATRSASKVTRKTSTLPVTVSVEPFSAKEDVAIDAQRHEAIALAAYYLAAERGFEAGHELDDWVNAEMQFDTTRVSEKS